MFNTRNKSGISAHHACIILYNIQSLLGGFSFVTDLSRVSMLITFVLQLFYPGETQGIAEEICQNWKAWLQRYGPVLWGRLFKVGLALTLHWLKFNLLF